MTREEKKQRNKNILKMFLKMRKKSISKSECKRKIIEKYNLSLMQVINILKSEL